MNHKRKNTKNQRAGCLMCKPNKMNGRPEKQLGHKGFGKLRELIHTDQDLKDHKKEN
jgi:hypothetical protein